MMLALPDEIKRKIDVSSIRATPDLLRARRKDTKAAIMESFKTQSSGRPMAPPSRSGDASQPEEQFKKLGSIGREIWGRIE